MRSQLELGFLGVAVTISAPAAKVMTAWIPSKQDGLDAVPSAESAMTLLFGAISRLRKVRVVSVKMWKFPIG